MSDHPPRNRRNLPTAIARLTSGVSITAAQKRLDTLVASLQKQFPADYPSQAPWHVRLVPLKERLVGNVRQSLLLLFGAVGLVLLIACTNVANLLLARASARGREIAIRQALGATQMRLFQQLLTETLLLSLIGAAAGLLVLFEMKDLLIRLLPEGLPRLNEISINWSVLLFALGASLVAGIVFGLAPAFYARRIDVNHALKQQSRGSSGSREQVRTRRILVVGEFALSLVLLIAASLLLRSFWDLANVRLGFNPERVMTIRTRMPEPNDPGVDKYADAAHETPFLRELLRRCAHLPGVHEVAVGDTASVPLDESLRDLKLISEGQFLINIEGRENPGEQAGAVDRSSVTAEYFHLLGIPLLRGRIFNDSDTDRSQRVAVINEAMARSYWPNDDPLGKRFRSARANSPWITVVGVIPNARTRSLTEADVPQVYLDVYQTGAKRLAILLRGNLNQGSIPDNVREQVQALDSTLPVYGAQMLEDTVSASLGQRRFSLEIVTMFALTALLLAALGIYGVISYIVSERAHEIGIRRALGAQNLSIVGMIVRQGTGLAVAGTLVGIGSAIIISPAMGSLLYGVRPYDPAVFLSVPLLLFAVALIASYIPALRATKIDPMIALRAQ